MRQYIPLLLSCLLVACGGGGGGGGGDSGTGSATPVTPSGPAAGSSLYTTSVSGGSISRTVSGGCSATQTLAAARNDGLRIQAVQWLQVVGQDAAASPRLVAGKPARLRVDLLANSARSQPARRELQIYDPDTARCTTLTLNGPATVPTSIDATTLTRSYVVDIAATSIKPGVSFSLLMDDSGGRSASEADQVFTVLKPAIASAVSETVYIIPISFGGQTGYVPASDSAIINLLLRLHPISAVTLSRAPAFAPPSLTLGSLTQATLGIYVGLLNNMQAVLDDVDNQCASLSGNQTSARTAPKCIGVFPDNLSFRTSPTSNGRFVGLAYVGGTTLIAESFSSVDDTSVSDPYQNNHWLTYKATTIGHEFGHLFNLNHADCGGAGGLDNRLYADGRLGSGSGYDLMRGYFFSATRNNTDGSPQFADLMSYCGKEWMSDRGYLAAMGYRSDSVSARTSAASNTGTARQWYKLSPSENGRWRLRPVAFAPATLVASPLRLEVISDRGSESLALASAVLSDSPATGNGPFYLDLGNRMPVRMSLNAGDGRAAMSWQPLDWQP